MRIEGTECDEMLIKFCLWENNEKSEWSVDWGTKNSVWLKIGITECKLEFLENRRNRIGGIEEWKFCFHFLEVEEPSTLCNLEVNSNWFSIERTECSLN